VGPAGDVESGIAPTEPEPVVEDKNSLAVPQQKKDKEKEGSRADLYK